MVGLVDRVTRRLRDAGRVGRTVVLRLRFDDFERITRSHTLTKSTSHTATILDALRKLLGGAMPLIDERGITLIGVTDASDVTALLAGASPATSAIAAHVDEIVRGLKSIPKSLDDVRERFGSKALTRAVMLGRAPGIEMPLLPD